MVHGPQRPFACLLCDHAATKIEALAAHVRKHLFLYVCCECDGKFVSSQRLMGHLKEYHAELDQEQAFATSIDSSFYLMQPGGGIWGSEHRGDAVERSSKESLMEQRSEDERKREEAVRNGVGNGEREQLEVTGEEVKSQHEGAEEEHVIKEATEKERHSEQEGAHRLSQETLHETVSLETQETGLPANEDTSALRNTSSASCDLDVQSKKVI